MLKNFIVFMIILEIQGFRLKFANKTINKTISFNTFIFNICVSRKLYVTFKYPFFYFWQILLMTKILLITKKWDINIFCTISYFYIHPLFQKQNSRRSMMDVLFEINIWLYNLMMIFIIVPLLLIVLLFNFFIIL